MMNMTAYREALIKRNEHFKQFPIPDLESMTNEELKKRANLCESMFEHAFIEEHVKDLELVINDILKISEANLLESKVIKALDLINKIEGEHRLADILSDEWKSLSDIIHSLGNLKLHVVSLNEKLFPVDNR